MLWDTHMHSQFSGDSHTPRGRYDRCCKTKNLKGICFTDHLDIDYPDEPGDIFAGSAELCLFRGCNAEI